MTVKKVTIRRKMSQRDFINLAYWLETGDRRELDLSDYDSKALSTVETRYFRVTESVRDKIDEFFSDYGIGISYQAILDKTPKAKKPITALQTIPISSPSPAITPAIPQCGDGDSNAASDSASGCDNFGRYPVLDDEQRWDWAKQDRQRIMAKNYWDIKVELKDYPFIKNPNKPLTLDNFDMPMAIWMCEHAKVSSNEMVALAHQNNAERLLQTKPSDHEGTPKRYIHNANYVTCFMFAETIGNKYEEWVKKYENNYPTNDEILERYKDYVFRVNKPVCPDFISHVDFTEKFVGIEDNSIILVTEDDAEEEKRVIQYDTIEDIQNDLVALCKFKNNKFNVNPKQSYTAFGKTFSIDKYVKALHKKYPNGFDGQSFFNTELEAYEAGKLEL